LIIGRSRQPTHAALERLRKLAHLLPALSSTESAAEAYASIRAALESKGEMSGNNDLWIAAHAVLTGWLRG